MSDNEYTPSMEYLAMRYVTGERRRNEAKGADYHQTEPELRAEFDRALAAHDRELAVNVLRDAADDAERVVGATDEHNRHVSVYDGATSSELLLQEWLNSRASRIESGEVTL